MTKNFKLKWFDKIFRKLNVGSRNNTMKVKLTENKIIFDFFIALLLTLTLIPLNLTTPEDDISRTYSEYENQISDYGLYSTTRNRVRAGHYTDQYFSETLAIVCFFQVSFIFVVHFSEQLVYYKLLSYNLISLPPPLI